MNSKHVVIADGDMLSANTIKEILEKNGYIVDAVVNDGIDGKDSKGHIVIYLPRKDSGKERTG